MAESISKGYYSIVQYQPYPRRHEGINVGVLLFETYHQHFNFILTRPFRRIQSLYRTITEESLAQLNVSFYNQLMTHNFESLDDLTHFCLGQKSTLHCTEPEYISIRRPEDFSAVLQELLTELVLFTP